ncbi:hypothetical protein [Chondromyces apiculatus]|uniref:Uncharacterized protein n=1 Tax=Chondromyces apiculatus DSM 436 TaxID=1192034 RepID=A0A017TCC2_9BACT|nr:hypothetical protein [Chondromyces apiculatus]EYF06271.1 Hypothetical protein CAP_2149 [Chondromyces apiculatus DSM 436]
MDKISLTYFVDFVLKAGTPKLAGVREWKERKDDLSFDFYRQIREAIVDMHRNGKPDTVLDEFLAAQRDERRRRVYPSIVEGYRKLQASSKMTWFEPPVGSCKLGDVEININPDLGLVIDGKPHLIKIYFRGEPLSAKRTTVVLNLLAGGLAESNPGKVLALLDVRNAKLHTFKAPNPRLGVLLRGEAAAFSTIYAAL